MDEVRFSGGVRDGTAPSRLRAETLWRESYAKAQCHPVLHLWYLVKKKPPGPGGFVLINSVICFRVSSRGQINEFSDLFLKVTGIKIVILSSH